MDEELARKQVEQELHFDELQERVRRSEEYIQNMNRTVQYERQKMLLSTRTLYIKAGSRDRRIFRLWTDIGI